MNYADIQPAPMAVYCRGLTKSLGSGKSKIDVLCGLNMSVPQGAIYGLLGASGCGKTTLLKCVIGRMQLDGGHLRTLGKVPGSRSHEVPGKMVGYMPQEISLFKKLTIRETLTLFGRLHGMTKKDIQKGIDFSLGFLNLPDDGRLVENLRSVQRTVLGPLLWSAT
ncbi:unnamed protein product [Lymnaea stagnalis]|uniref:ABC transporter domain-containing protein n=1 Tax=Lymnaea stagnalis TaxID=6523 RepID=A0AAV2ICM4_LYMST